MIITRGLREPGRCGGGHLGESAAQPLVPGDSASRVRLYLSAL